MQHLLKANNTNKRLQSYKRRSLHALLTLVFFMPIWAWGQTGLSGLYYIANADGYNSSNSTNNWYLIPADDPQKSDKNDAFYSADYATSNGDPEKPFLATYRTNKDAADVPSGVVNDLPNNSVWILKEISGESGFYYIIHASSGKYVVYEPPYSTKTNRKSMHLLATDSPGENAKFAITTGYNIRPKSLATGNRFFNPAGSNQPYYYGNGGSDNPAYNYIGLVGVYSATTGNSIWHFEETHLTAPTISIVDEYTNTFTITDANNLPSGYTIRYTIGDGSQNAPTATTGEEYTNPIPVTISRTVKAVVVRYGLVLTDVAERVVSPVVATPVISFDYLTNKASISCVTPSATIYYNTGDGSQADPTTSTGTEYVNPIDVTSPTTVKAISSLDSEVSSVATLAIAQVATPTIQDNGSNAISITSTTDGATIYYTTDGSNPTTLSTPYTEPLTENVSNVTIKAIAVKENMIISEVGSGSVMLKCATPVITKTSDDTFTISCDFPASDVTLYYEMGESPSDPTTSSSSSIASGGTVTATFPTTVKAMATASNYNNSEVAVQYISATPDYSGYFYLQSQGDLTYYMIPSGTNHPDNGNPLVQTKKEQKLASVWQIQKEDNTDYYRIIHYSDNKYLVADHTAPTQSVWLVDSNPDDGTELFELEVADPGIFNIKPKDASNADDKNYLNVSGGNGSNHTIGLWTAADNNSKWAFTKVPAQPTFAVNNDIRVTITNVFANGNNNIHYTIDGEDPTSSSTSGTSVTLEYGPEITVKAICVYDDPDPDWVSDVASITVQVPLIMPVFTRNGNTVTISNTQKVAYSSKVDFWYTIGELGTPENPVPGDSDHGELYGGPIELTSGRLYIIKAIAYNPDHTEYVSAVATFVVDLREPTEITSFAGITDVYGYYKFADNFEATGTPSGNIGTTTNPFKGTLDGNMVAFALESDPLFECVEDATIKNMNITSVSISTSGDAGAIANKAKGATRIYNCGVLAGTVNGSGKVGGLVGMLEGSSRVINCFSYADITGGTDVGGIVGYNNENTTAASINTMVMNCMFYGDITDGVNKSPVYGGNNIANLQGGLNTFNYYAYKKLPTEHITSGKYNSTLAVEDKYLNRFEFYRLLLNSNKKLAAIYATGSAEKAGEMAKWVLETADRTNPNPKPYPILKPQGVYPSIINPDIEHAPDSTSVGPNKGGYLGKTLSVNISDTKTDGGQTWPDGVSITISSLTLKRTDKDFDRFNYNYDKVQLPYYNDVGTGNYTGNRVVTGWKITAFTDVDGDPYTSANYDYSMTYASNQSYFDYPNYNFADRKSSNKDLYSVSGRVFSQGAYFDVPYGVTSITIEPYWAKACYIADLNYDAVYKSDYSDKQNVTQTGIQANPGTTTFNEQRIENTVANALTYINNHGGYGPTVYDNAVVLVGNLHLANVPSGGDTPFTMMSVDEDNDHEPDYSLIYHHKNRTVIAPIRFDFLNIPGTAQAQKPNGASLVCNFTIFKTKGWFETTNTAFFYTSQLEYENKRDVNYNNTGNKDDAPLILLGGVIDQFVSTQSDEVDGKTIYIHVGGNVWINSFGLGTHGDGSQSTPHVPVSVTGGEYKEFYLTGTYNANATVRTDNAECYISGGYFHEAAGASQEQIDGDVRWQIYNADIENFYGGGTNDAKPITGDVTTEIFNSRVTTYCGGPKFGDMQSGKKVTTNAEGCTFGKFFGAGYGGLSYVKKKYTDATTYDFSTLQGYYTGDKGKYYDGVTTPSAQQSSADYGKKGPGVATDFDYEFFVWSTGPTGARFYVKFASFSLAQCNDVESTLKNCTINENFYGGGSLGKVVGTTTSVLDGCTVKGNVFGAGYSATLPKIYVRDGGFTKNPNFNTESGMFEPGVFSDTTDFTWRNAAEAGVTLTNGGSGSDLTNHYVYTDANLSSSNLGSVQAASLTIKGNSVVGTENDPSTGNVYGGGDESEVVDNTTVILGGDTNVRGNVYGGGNRGTVSGNSSVTIEDPAP